MDLQKLEKEINLLLSEYDKEKKGAILYEIENIFELYLKENPRDSEVWLQFARFELDFFQDDYKAQDLLLEVLAYEPNNAYAVLLLAYLAFTISNCYIEESLKLLDQLQTNDKEILSMIEYAKALYCLKRDYKRYAEYLKKSIEYDNKFVWNNFYLGLIYLERNKKDEAKELIKKAYDNVQLIYIFLTKNKSRITPIKEFLNERLKGTFITRTNLASIKSELKDLNIKF